MSVFSHAYFVCFWSTTSSMTKHHVTKSASNLFVKPDNESIIFTDLHSHKIHSVHMRNEDEAKLIEACFETEHRFLWFCPVLCIWWKSLRRTQNLISSKLYIKKKKKFNILFSDKVIVSEPLATFNV